MSFNLFSVTLEYTQVMANSENKYLAVNSLIEQGMIVILHPN